MNSKDKNFKSNTKPNKPFLTDLKIMSSILVVRSDIEKTKARTEDIISI